MADYVATRNSITHTSGVEDRLKRDVAESIFAYAPSGLLALKGGTIPGEDGQRIKVPGLLKTKTAMQRTVEWYEKDAIGESFVISATVTGYTATTFGIQSDASSPVRVKDVYICERTREIVYVQARTSATQLTIVRGIGETTVGTGITIASGDVFYRIGFAGEEAGSKRTVKYAAASKKTNYTQIFKTTMSISRNDIDVDTYAGKNLPELRAETLQQHCRDLEASILLGKKQIGSATAADASGNHVQFMGGLLNYITTNAYDASSGGYSISDGYAGASGHGGNLSAYEFINQFAMQVGRYNRNGAGEAQDMYFIGGNAFAIAFSEYAKSGGSLEVSKDDDMFGVRINTLITPMFNIKLIRSGILEEYARDLGFLFKPANLAWRPFVNADTKLQTNIQLPDFDGIEDQYITEGTLEVAGEKAAGVISGVTSIDL